MSDFVETFVLVIKRITTSLLLLAWYCLRFSGKKPPDGVNSYADIYRGIGVGLATLFLITLLWLL